MNKIIGIYKNEEIIGNFLVYPTEGNVAFGSAKHGWAFTLNTFARMYGKIKDKDPENYLKYLWGDNFYNKNT